MQATSSNQRIQQLLPELFEPLAQTGDRYLRFQLTDEWTAIFPFDSICETIQIPATRITPLPNLPACALGLVNAFNKVFCAIDLAQLLGVGLLASNPRDYSLMAARAIPAEESHQTAITEEEPVLGLVVHQVLGVINILPDAIEATPKDLPGSLVPYVQGMSSGALLLDIDAVIAAPGLTEMI